MTTIGIFSNHDALKYGFARNELPNKGRKSLKMRKTLHIGIT